MHANGRRARVRRRRTVQRAAAAAGPDGARRLCRLARHGRAVAAPSVDGQAAHVVVPARPHRHPRPAPTRASIRSPGWSALSTRCSFSFWRTGAWWCPRPEGGARRAVSEARRCQPGSSGAGTRVASRPTGPLKRALTGIQQRAERVVRASPRGRPPRERRCTSTTSRQTIASMGDAGNALAGPRQQPLLHALESLGRAARPC